jgi:membrane-bound lytic murein transglycosylase D
MKFIYLILLVFAFSLNAFAQPGKPTPLKDDQFANVVEQSLSMYYADYAKKTGSSYEKVIADLNYDGDQVIEFSDEIYCQRLTAMNKLTPFKLECNEITIGAIRYWAAKRRGFVRVALGRSPLYFDMYEAKLAEYNLPLELKYLSVIESGLRPQVKSRAGALGLWQFMYGTGKMFGLKENSYIDERMNPELATDAACRYLKQLHGIYNDWNLALAAYNAGPGNVNKAIRRSGNKTTYWEIRSFLPRETQEYVPRFIAAAYLMIYHAEHNIIPAEAPIHYAQLDTICLSKSLHMSTITEVIGWSENEIKELNPIYRGTFIPETTPKQCLSGPLATIGKFASMEDSIYGLENAKYYASKIVPPPPVIDTTAAVVQVVEPKNPKNTVVVNEPETKPEATSGKTSYHKVKRGESLGTIATTYGTTVSKIMNLNNLRSTSIYVGQKLKVEGEATQETATTTTPTPKTAPPKETKKYYVVRNGDNFGAIAQRHGKSISQLQKLNPGVNVDRLSIGQKLRVK